jgi:hypothetical protein
LFGVFGLRNNLNFCWCNAILQLLLVVPAFQDTLLRIAAVASAPGSDSGRLFTGLKLLSTCRASSISGAAPRLIVHDATSLGGAIEGLSSDDGRGSQQDATLYMVAFLDYLVGSVDGLNRIGRI